MNHERAFRDYATRVSFNISMSRNQVAVFRAIVIDLEYPPVRYGGMKSGVASVAYTQERRDIGIPDARITGLRWLIMNGFVREKPEIAAMRLAHDKDGKKWDWTLFEKYVHHHELTAAGEHMAALLRIAGLIPQRAVNANKKRKRRAA